MPHGGPLVVLMALTWAAYMSLVELKAGIVTGESITASPEFIYTKYTWTSGALRADLLAIFVSPLLVMLRVNPEESTSKWETFLMYNTCRFFFFSFCNQSQNWMKRITAYLFAKCWSFRIKCFLYSFFRFFFFSYFDKNSDLKIWWSLPVLMTLPSAWTRNIGFSSVRVTIHCKSTSEERKKEKKE